MQKNVSSQIWIIFAFNRTTNVPLTGDAANITANLRIDGGAADAVDDTNPTELEDGYYYFDLTQAETNGDTILISPVSSTSDIQVIGVPGTVFTTPPNFPEMSIESDGDLSKVNALDGHTVQTGDNYARIGTNGASLTDLGGMSTGMKAEINAEADTAISDYDPPTHAELVSEINDVQTDVAALNNLSAAQVNAEVDTALADYDSPTKAEMDTAHATTDALVTTVDGVVDTILVDTNELQTNQGDWATATGFATAAALTTHDGKLDTVDGVVDAILADTDELQTSQGDWATATGFATTAALSTHDGKLDTVDSIVDAILVDTGTAIPALIAALNDLSAAQINAEVDTALTDYDPPTNAEMAARTLLAANYFDPITDAVANVTLVATTTTNTDMRGTDSAALASVATEARLTELDGVNLPTDIADIPTVSEFNARTQPTADYFDWTTDTVANVTTTANLTTNNDKTGYALSAAGIQAIWDALTSALTTASSVGKLLVDNINATISSRSSHGDPDPSGYLDAAVTSRQPSGAVNLVADQSGATIGTVNVIAGTIGTLDALDTAQDTQHSQTQSDIAALNDISTADVNTEVNTALTDIHLDHLFATDYDPSAKPGSATALLNELVENDAGVTRYTANALEQAPTGDSAPTVSEIVDGVWDEDIVAAHNTADTAGAILDDLTTPGDFKANVSNLDATVSSRATQVTVDAIETDTQDIQTQIGTAGSGLVDLGGMSTGMKAEVEIEATDALNAYDPPTNAEMEARTVPTADYFDPAVDTVASVTDVVNQVAADVTAISGDSAAADNLELQYDTTGLTGDTFPSTQAQLNNISSGTAATNVVAVAVDVTTGVEVNSYTDTAALDGTVHEVNPSGGNTTFHYEFNVGANGVPVAVQWQGYANSNGDNYIISAYNWAGVSWDQIGEISGTPGSAVIQESFDLTTAHVGTGANAGLVHWQVVSTDGTGFNTDRILCSFATVFQSVGYALGSIWVDTNASNTNTESFVDGVADNPVSTWAAALTLSGQLGIEHFQIANGSSIVLSGNSDNYTLSGFGWTLALGTRSIEGLFVEGASVFGIGTATVTHPQFEKCGFGTVTLPPSVLRWCGIGAGSGQFTAGSAGQYFIVDCVSMVPGSGSPTLVFSGLGATTEINTRRWSGGATYTLDSDCILTHEVVTGGGTTIATGGADVEIRGITRSISLTLSGAGTVQTDAITGPITISGAATTTVNLHGVSSSLADTSSGTSVNDYTVSQSAIDARTLVSASYFDPAADTVATVTEVTQMAGTIGTLDALDTAQDAQHASTQADVAALNDVAATDIVTGGAIDTTGGVVDTVTDVTNLHASAATVTNQTTLLNRIGTFTGSGVNTIIGFFQALLRNDVSTPSDVGGTYDDATDSLQAIRDRGDAAWVTGAGGISPTVEEIRTEMDDNSTQLAAIVTDTNELQTDDVPGLIAALNDLSAAQVNIEVDTALTDYDSPTKAEMDAGHNLLATAADLTTVDGIVNAILADTDITIPALIAALNNLSTAQVNAEVDTALVDYDGPTNTEMTAAFTEIKGATWASGTDTLEAIRDVEPHGTAMRGTDGASTTVPPTVTEIRTEMDSSSTQLAAIVADTNELQVDDVPGLIAALNDPASQAIVGDLMSEILENGKTVEQAMLDMWAVLIGDSAADDATNPTSITYDSPDGSVQRTHALTSTTRTQS